MPGACRALSARFIQSFDKRPEPGWCQALCRLRETQRLFSTQRRGVMCPCGRRGSRSSERARDLLPDKQPAGWGGELRLGRSCPQTPKPVALNTHPLSTAWPQAARLLPLAQCHRGEDSRSAEGGAAGQAGRGLAARGLGRRRAGGLCHICAQEVWFAPNPSFMEQEPDQEGTHTAPESHSSSAGPGLVVSSVGGGEGHHCL